MVVDDGRMGGGCTSQSGEVGVRNGTEGKETRRELERGERGRSRGGEGKAERELTPLPRHQIAATASIVVAQASERWRTLFLLHPRGE